MLNIVIPVYNEGGNIIKLFDQISKEIHTPVELIIVYDFDEDNTVLVVKQNVNKYKFAIRLEKNLYGKGALNAIKTGLFKSTHDVILVIMADLSDSLEIVDKMYCKIQEGYDVVCGSRYMKGGKQIGGPLLKKTFSRIAGVSLHYLIGIPTHDITNSFKMYTKKLIDSVRIESDGGFEISMELTVKAYLNGFKITEIPSYWYDRTDGQSNFKMWKWLPQYLKWYKLGICSKWFGSNKQKGIIANGNNNSISS